MRWLVLAWALTGCGFRPQQIGDAGGGDATDGRPDVPPGFVPTSPRKLTFANSGTSILSSFQVLVALDSTTVDYTKVANPTTDLAFQDASMTKLPFEVERWDPAGESDVWVRVPQIPPGSSSILMYFGSGANIGSSALPVWGGYELVTHFATPLVSSTGTYAPLAHNVSMVAGGRAATAVAFTGTGDEQVNFASAGALFDGWNAMTFAFSIYPDYASTAGYSSTGVPILDKGGSLTLGRFYVNGGTTPGMLTLQVDMHFAGGGNDAYLNTDVPLRTWTDLAFTYDGTTLRLYNNGTEDSTMTMGNPPRAMLVDTQSFYLGDPIAAFTGKLDELRIEQANRSADWVMQTHRSLARAFVTIGDP